MAFFDVFTRLYFWIFNIPYYNVIVINDGEKVKTIIQKVTDAEKGKDIAIIDRKAKKAWWKISDICFRDGKKFIMYVKLNNAIPLIADTETITTGKWLTKKVTISRLKNEPIFNVSQGKPVEFTEIPMPPSDLFEIIDGFFVKQITAKPPSKWEEIRGMVLIIAIAVIIVAYFILSSGVMGGTTAPIGV